MARLRAEVKNLHLPGCPDPNAEKYQALSLAVEKLPPLEQLLAQWLPDAAGRYLVLCEDDADGGADRRAGRERCLVRGCISAAPMRFPAMQSPSWPTRPTRSGCWSASTVRLSQTPLTGISGVVLVRRTAEARPPIGRCWPAPSRPAAVCRWQS